MARLRVVLTMAVAVGVFGSGAFCLAQTGRAVKLEIHPQKAPVEVGEFSLLPSGKSLIDGDAISLYEKAAKALPDKAGDQQIQQWLEMPIGQLPVEPVEQTLAKYTESLKSAARAARCRQCDWPQWEPGKESMDLTGYRRLALVVRLWARLEIAGEGYDGAVLALQTGFGMGRHLGQGPTIMQMLVAVAVGQAMCTEIEEFVQGADAPNLYLALGALPRPFVDIEKAIECENKAASAQAQNKALGEQIENQLKMAHDRVRLVAQRIDVHVAALQCVEAIRSYAASHGGQLPGTLAEIAENPVPKDPVSGGAFRYTRTGVMAVLESTLPPGASEKDQIRYEIAVKN